MPPALAGDNSEVDASADGVQNFGSVVAGLTLAFVAVGAASYVKDRLLSVAGVDAEGQTTLTVE